MAYTLPTDDEILALAISYFTIAHRDPVTGKSPPLGPRDFLGQEARALTSLLRSVLAGVASVDADAIPGVFTDSAGVTRTRNSTASLDDWASTLGLPSSTPGVFGRKGARAATGGAALSGLLASSAFGLVSPPQAASTNTNDSEGIERSSEDIGGLLEDNTDRARADPGRGS